MRIDTLYKETMGKRLTRAYIAKTIDIDSFRKTKMVKKEFMNIDLDDYPDLDSIIRKLERIRKECGNCETEMCSTYMSVSRFVEELETDDEVITRVIEEIKGARKAIADAKRALEKLSKIGVSI